MRNRYLWALAALSAFVFANAVFAEEHVARSADSQNRTDASDNAGANAPAPLKETKRLVDRPDERVSLLDNGLTLVVKAHRTAPVVSVRMYCKTGSIYEQEYLGAGMSHLFEHLLHGAATTTRSEADSRRILDDIGGNTNAYTSIDHTCYFINTTKAHAATAIDLLGDWITHPTFPEEAFQREWGVVQRELERDVDEPTRQLYYMTMDTMYRDHPARHPVIGYKPVVQSLTKEDIVGYHERMYVPDNIVVVIAGDVDLDEMLETVSRQFAGFRRKRVPNIVLPPEKPLVTPRHASRHMKVQSAMMNLAWPSIPLTHPDLYALDVLSYILTQGNSSLLVRTVRDGGLVLSITSYSWTPQWGNGMFVINSRLDPSKVEAARAAVLEQIAAVQAELIPDDVLAKAKKQKAAELVMGMQTADDVAANMGRDYLSTGDIHFSQAYVDNIQKVTPEQVRDVARRYLVPEKLATMTILPEGAPMSESERAAAAGEPEPVREIVLDNGLRVLIRRDPTTPLVSMQAYTLGGVTYENEQTNGLAKLASLLVTRGTETRTAQDIAGFFDARGGSIGASSGNNSIFAQAEVLSGDFADAMEVFADVVLNPTFPQQELDLYRPRLLDAIKRLDETWRTELFAYARHRFFKHSPYRFDDLGSLDVVGTATREDIAAFYNGLVTGPNTVLAIYGDVDAKLAESLARRYFGSMPDAKVPVPNVEPEPAITSPKLYVLKKSGDRQAAGIALGFPGMTVGEKQDRAEMAVLDTIISGYRYPTGWLHDALRGGDRDYVYEVHAVNRPGVLPGLFQIYAACQPDKVNEVYDIITSLLDKARAGEFTAEELERAKEIIVTTELMENQTNASRAMQDGLNELYGLGAEYNEAYLGAVKAVTLDDVKRVAEKYLTTPQIAIVTPAPDLIDIGVEPAAVHQTLLTE